MQVYKMTLTHWQEKLLNLLTDYETYFDTGKIWTETDIKTRYPNDDIAHLGYDTMFYNSSDNRYFDPMYGNPYPTVLHDAMTTYHKTQRGKITKKPKRCSCKKKK